MKLKNERNEEILDWTVSEAPFAASEAVEIVEAAEPFETAARPLRPTLKFKPHISPTAALTLIGVSLAVLLGVAGYTAWQNFTLRQTLIPLVQAEDEARLSGDTNKLGEFIDEEVSDWQFDQMFSSQTYPAALAWPVSEVGTVQTVKRLGSDLVQVDVARPYANQPSYGTPQQEAAYSFIQPQFYRWQNETWKRTRPPETYFGERQRLAGGRIEWVFPAVDGDLIDTVRPNVERILNEACGWWACPAEFGLTVTFITRTAISSWYTNPPHPAESLVLSFYQNDGGVVYSANTLILPSPHSVGLPANAKAQQLFERNLTLRILANTLHRLNIMRGARRNVFWMALAARLATRFEFENARYRVLTAPEPVFTPEELWNLRVYRNPGQFSPELRDAQILLNRLLLRLPPEAEQQLFATLPAAQNQVDWLVKALNISREEAEAHWQAVLTPVQVMPLTGMPDKYALYCLNTTGLSLWDGTSNPPYAALPDNVASGVPMSWSPDGQRLLMRMGYFSEQVGVVDFAARRVLWLPYLNGWPHAEWLTNTHLAYTLPSLLESSYMMPGAGQLMVLDTAHPNQAPVEIAEVNYFTTAPDSAQLAVVGQPPGTFEDYVGVLSAEDYEIRWLTSGYTPVWLAEGRQIIYTVSQPQLQLNLLEVQTGLTRTLISPETLAPLLPSPMPLVQSLNLLTVEGDDVYFAAYTSPTLTRNRAPDTLIGRMNLSSGEAQRLYYAKESWVNFYGFFEDQRYLLITAQSYTDNQSSFLIVEAATGRIARTLEGYIHWYGANFPNAHHPLLMDIQGRLFSLREPFGDLEPYTSAVATQGCGEMVLNPALNGP